MNLHFPAHESLQEFAIRTGRSLEHAYRIWHNRVYGEVKRTPTKEDPSVGPWPYAGVGLRLLPGDIANIAKGRT